MLVIVLRLAAVILFWSTVTAVIFASIIVPTVS